MSKLKTGIKDVGYAQYRINNKLARVLPKQLALDIDAQYEITDPIIKAMNEKHLVFGKLPLIQIKKETNMKSKK